MTKRLDQKIVRDTTHNIGGYIHGAQYVICPVCLKEVATSYAYFDPYFSDTHSARVHSHCLSVRRKTEIIREENMK